MADFNELKQKMLAKLGQAADGAKDIAAKAADKAKTGGRIAKLSMEIAGEKENMRKTYIEIGKLYYDTHKEDPEGFFIQLCDEITLAEKNIADKEAEIDMLKAGCDDDEADIEVEFEEVVSCDEAAACDCDCEEPDGTCDIPEEETEEQE